MSHTSFSFAPTLLAVPYFVRQIQGDLLLKSLQLAGSLLSKQHCHTGTTTSSILTLLIMSQLSLSYLVIFTWDDIQINLSSRLHALYLLYLDSNYSIKRKINYQTKIRIIPLQIRLQNTFVPLFPPHFGTFNFFVLLKEI